MKKQTRYHAGTRFIYFFDESDRKNNWKKGVENECVIDVVSRCMEIKNQFCRELTEG
jgi:hypothetical protein